MITSQNAAQAITKLVAARALPALVGNLVMGNLVNRDYEASLARAGDVVNVAIPPVMVAGNMAEAGSMTNQDVSLGNAQIVLNQHKVIAFEIPDVTKALVQPDIIDTYMNPALIGIAEAIETDLLALYDRLTANTAVGAATAMDEARVDAAETTLFTAKVPQSQAKYLVLSPAAYGQARQLARFTEMQTSGNGAAIASGVTGTLKGFQVFRSQFVAKPSTTTYNIAFAKDALALAIRRLDTPLPGTGAIAEYVDMGGFGLRVTMSYAHGSLSNKFSVDVLYGCNVLRNNHGVQVQSN
jgi:hypothetical protein